MRRKSINKNESGETNSLKAFLTNKRLHLGIGIVLCFFAILSVVICISFLASNEADQSITSGRSATEIVNAGEQTQIHNSGSVAGAKLASLLLVNAFGIGSFAISIYLFLLGLACMHVKKIQFWSVTFRCLFTAVAVSVIVGLFTINEPMTFPPGGNHGKYINELLIDYSGALGAYSVSVLMAALLILVFYNPICRLFAIVAGLLPRRVKEVDDSEAGKSAAADEKDILNSLDDTDYLPDNEQNDDSRSDDTDTDTDTDGFAIDYTPSTSNSDKPSTPSTEPAPVAIIQNGPDDIVMEVKVAQADTGTVIQDGDHRGLDTVYDPRATHSGYTFPPTTLLKEYSTKAIIDDSEHEANKQRIVKAFRSYNIEIIKISATVGPTVTLYEIVPSEGTRINKIKSLEDDIAMTISATGIRIIAPIPGRGTIGIEVPNRDMQIVGMRRVLESSAFQSKKSKLHLPIALGATISNEIFIEDLTKMPHLLVAGATGQGKSVGLNCIITSLLYSKHPDELKFILVDPKMVEFSVYSVIDKAFMAKLPDEESAIITAHDKALATLNSLCVEMDARYELFSSAPARDIETYNARFVARKLPPTAEHPHRYMPYLVVIVDEFADLVSGSSGKEIFVPIARLAAKGRAAGIHVILATQRPSTDVITGMIKANFPARIAFRVLSSIDSKTILDRPGAHRLIGRGDMLALINGAVERVQCGFVDTDEIESICDFISKQDGFVSCYELPPVPSDGESITEVNVDVRNEEFIQCCKYIAMQTTASITILQRKFSIGFNKAGRYIDQMEALGIVGPSNGSKPRQVLMSLESVEQLFGG